MSILNKTEIKIFLTFLLVYSIFIWWGGVNENSRFFLTKAIVDEGKLTIDSFYNQTADRAYYNGHYYSEKAPGMSFLAVPIYTSWKFIYNAFFPVWFKEKYIGTQEFVIPASVGNENIIAYTNPGIFYLTSLILITIFTSSLFAALTVVLIYKISSYFLKNEKHKIILAFIFGLGTTIFPYGLVFLGDATGTFFIFLAYYLIFKFRFEKSENPKTIFLAGLFSGIAVTVEYLAGIFLPFLFIILFFSKGKKYLVNFIAGLFLGALPLLIYNYLIFGNPFELARSHLDPKFYPGKYTKNFGFIYSINPFIISKELLDSYRGLFFYYPLFLLSIPGLYLMFKNYKMDVIAILLSFIVLVILISTLFNWWGGAVFGPRYLSTTIPFLFLPIIFIFSKIIKPPYCILFIFLVGLSFFHNLIGIQNPENIVIEKNGIETAETYRKLENTFSFWPNPLYTYYLPLFIKYGPRSRIIESLINGHIDIDIRHIAFSRGVSLPDQEFYIPFLGLAVALVVIAVIWRKEFVFK